MNEQQTHKGGLTALASELIGIGGNDLHFDEQVARTLTGHLDELSTFAQRRKGLDELTSVWEVLALERQLEAASGLVAFIFSYASRVGGESKKERQVAKSRGGVLEDYVRSQAAPAPTGANKPWSIMFDKVTPH